MINTHTHTPNICWLLFSKEHFIKASSATGIILGVAEGNRKTLRKPMKTNVKFHSLVQNRTRDPGGVENLTLVEMSIFMIRKTRKQALGIDHRQEGVCRRAVDGLTCMCQTQGPQAEVGRGVGDAAQAILNSVY